MNRIHEILGIIGEREGLRRQFIESCRLAEAQLARLDFNVREEITGPIIDALHTRCGILKKRIKPGIDFYFLYRSKIARDLVMSAEEEPDHVWEPQTTRLLLYFSRDANHVVVGGAYSGDQAIPLAHSLRGSGGICHCFEPNSEQLDMLRLNADRNSLNNLVLNPFGLWADDGTRLVLVGDDSFAHPELATVEGSEESFPTITLNSYGNQRGVSHFDVIILDIEGAELPALRGADQYLKQPVGQAPHLIFEVHRNYVDWSRGLENTEIVRYLRSLGYTIFALRDYQSNVSMTGYPIEIIPPSDAYIEGPPHGFNMMAVKDLAVLNSDLFRIRKGVSPKLLSHRDPALHQPVADHRDAAKT